MIQWPTLSLRQLLRLDGIGAVLSTVLLAGLVAQRPDWFGMPPTIVYVLAGVAAIFALYSWLNVALVANLRPYQVGIITVANTMYAAGTLSLVVWYHDILQPLGYCYFLVELAVLGWLIRLEWVGIQAITRKT